jgi:hypothetical protein
VPPQAADTGRRTDDHRTFSKLEQLPPVPTPVRRYPAPRPLAETGYELTRDQRYHAARVAASAANDADDCALLLAVLGLEPADGITSPPPSRSGHPGG